MTVRPDIDLSKFFEVEVKPEDGASLSLKRPIKLYVDDVPGNVYVLWPALNEYGVGVDLSEALTNLFDSVWSFYQFMLNNTKKLSPALTQTLAEFSEVIDGKADHT